MLSTRLALAMVCLLLIPVAAIAGPDLDDLAREWSASEDADVALLGRSLGTLSGREALRERLEKVRDEMRSAAAAAAFRELVAEAYPVPGDRTPPSWLARLAMDYAIDVDSVHSRIAKILPRLSTRRLWERDLHEFLSRDDASELLYERFLRRHREPNPYTPFLSRVLVEGDDGRLRVPVRWRAVAERRIADREKVAAAGAKFTDVLLRRARELPPGSRIRGLFADPRYGAMRTRKATGGRHPDSAIAILGIMTRVIGGFTASDEARTEADWFDRELPHYEHLRREARAIAARIGGGADDLEARLRAYLRSPLGPCAAVDRPERTDFDAGKVLLEQSGFARFLAPRADGSLSVNRHTIVELDVLLQSLTEEGDRRAALAGTIGGDPAARILARYAEKEAASIEPDARAEWVDRNLVRGADGWRKKGVRRKEILRVAAMAWNIASRELGDEVVLPDGRVAGSGDPGDGACVPLELDPRALVVTTDGLDLFRSSIFYNPRTRAGAYYYSAAFPDHHTARLFGTFEWNARRTNSVDEFLLRLEEKKAGIARLSETHDRLIFVINTMPLWLSSSTDTGTYEGGAKANATAHPPKDWDEWARMVRGMAEIFKDIEGIERCYEFWNEPDLNYWQGSLEDFLKLYEVTAGAVKAGDPEGKFGGCAVNQWDGKIRKGASSDPLVFELIRYAAKRKLPLDFISWHHFGRPVEALSEAKLAYLKECAVAGLGHDPELFVTEWSWPGRGTPSAASSFAAMMVALAEANVDAQTAACWEEFHAVPDPKHYAPWGLITQQGVRKNAWYVHRFFDRLARDSLGWTVLRPDDGVAVVSKEADGTIELIVWRTGLVPRLEKAWKVLESSGFSAADGQEYGHLDRLERAILAEAPVDPKHRSWFRHAKRAYDSEPVRTTRFRLDVPNAKSITVLEAESVRMEHEVKEISVVGGRLACDLEPHEVLRLRVRVE